MRSQPRLTATPIAASVALLLSACSGAATQPPSDTSAPASAAASAPASVEASAEPSVAESMTASMSESTAGEPEPETTTVNITNTSFNTDAITVTAGATVTYVNNSSFPHTVTEGQDGNAADGARFDEQVNAGESVDIVFSEPGDYDVTCLFHSNMNMVVHVE